LYSAYIFLVVDGGYSAADCDYEAMPEDIHDLSVTAGKICYCPLNWSFSSKYLMDSSFGSAA
jgi:hypothetical protein